MTVHEPATLLTDLLLAACAGGLAWQLRRCQPADKAAVRSWSLMLGLTAIAALVGGTYHGFAPNFSPSLNILWWRLTLLGLCGASLMAARSLVDEMVPPGRRRPWVVLITGKFVLFAGVVLVHPVFIVAISDYGLVLLAWTAAACTTSRAWRGWMLGGVGLSVVAALVQQLRWAPTARFNHNDLYHVVQILALVAFYRAGRLFSTGPDARPRTVSR